MDRSSVTRRLDSGLSRICTSNFKTCAALQAPHDRSPIRRGGTPLINPEENRDSSSSKSYSFLVSLPLGNMGVMVGIRPPCNNHAVVELQFFPNNLPNMRRSHFVRLPLKPPRDKKVRFADSEPRANSLSNRWNFLDRRHFPECRLPYDPSLNTRPFCKHNLGRQFIENQHDIRIGASFIFLFAGPPKVLKPIYWDGRFLRLAEIGPCNLQTCVSRTRPTENDFRQ